MQVRALDEQRDEVSSRLSELERQIERVCNDPATRIPAPTG
jgi:hypothetical protein